MRAILKPLPPKAQLKALDMTSYYTSAMFYSAAVLIGLVCLGLEVYEKKAQGGDGYGARLRIAVSQGGGLPLQGPMKC